MNPANFIHEIDASLGAQWHEDRESQEYTEEEARIAAVLTRMDMGLAASLLGYNAKMLNSIRLGIWSLVALGIVHLVVQYV